jgi:succinyl-diaminopimelate desuccinylase
MNEIELAQELIRIDSTTGSPGERRALVLLQSHLERAGFTCSLDGYGENDADRCNLTARLNPGEGDKALMFCGHIDVVPAGETAWDFPPFSGRIEGGRILGRGAGDMKSGLAAMVVAAMEAAPKLSGRELILQVYGEEEIGCIGSLHAARDLARWCRATAAVVPEPTKNRPRAGHRGTFWLEAGTNGISAHASMPEAGESALTKLLPLAAFLDAYRPRHDEHPVLGRCSGALTTLRAGTAVNAVPDRARLTMDFRPVPGQDVSLILDDIKKAAPRDATIRILAEVPALWTDPAHPWLRDVRDICEAFAAPARATGEAHSVPFATDGAYLKKALPDMPVVILGPGDPARIHAVNESCELEDIRIAKRIYARIIERFYA